MKNCDFCKSFNWLSVINLNFFQLQPSPCHWIWCSLTLNVMHSWWLDWENYIYSNLVAIKTLEDDEEERKNNEKRCTRSEKTRKIDILKKRISLYSSQRNLFKMSWARIFRLQLKPYPLAVTTFFTASHSSVFVVALSFAPYFNFLPYIKWRKVDQRLNTFWPRIKALQSFVKHTKHCSHFKLSMG